MATLLEQAVGTWRSEKKRKCQGNGEKGEGAEEGRDVTQGEGRRRRQVKKRSTECEERW